MKQINLSRYNIRATLKGCTHTGIRSESVEVSPVTTIMPDGTRSTHAPLTEEGQQRIQGILEALSTEDLQKLLLKQGWQDV